MLHFLLINLFYCTGLVSMNSVASMVTGFTCHDIDMAQTGTYSSDATIL